MSIVIRSRPAECGIPGHRANLPRRRAEKGILCDHQAGENLLKRSMEKLNLSACAYDRILKVRRTVADLAGSDDIKVEHLAEAIHYRSLDREGWAG